MSVRTSHAQSNRTKYAYDAAGRLDTVDRTPSGGSPVRVADYAYDANGNRLCTDATGDTCPGTPAVYDAQDRLVTDEAGRSYSYTKAGELEGLQDGSLASTYAYDPLGNLRAACINATDPEDEDCETGTKIEYLVDGFGRRVGKRVNDTLQQGFLWSDRLRVVAELDENGVVVSRFVYAGRENVPDYMLKGGSTYRILTDHLGSVRLVVNADTGGVAQRIDYDSWGVPTFVTGSADFQPFGFAGGLYDSHTGLVRFGARDYDSRTGAWTTKDPLRFGGGQANLYRYAFADPINFIDLTGLDVVVIENGPTQGNPIGHTAVGVTGGGIYSFGNNTAPGSSVQGYLARETPRRNSTAYVIPTSPAQNAAVLAALNAMVGTPMGTLVDNCSSRSNAALDAAGVPGTPSGFPGGPFSPGLPPNIPGSAGGRAQAAGATAFEFPKNAFPGSYPDVLLQFEPVPQL
jgi:RHS repeat-associated protein